MTRFNEAFRKWFGDSKIVDEHGQPLVLYHGTPDKFDRFDLKFTEYSSLGASGGLGFFFTQNRKEAQHYATARRGGRDVFGQVISAYLSIQNPKTIEQYSAEADRMFNSKRDAMRLREELIAQGYDGAITHLGEFVAFYPWQIKTIDNRGTWNKDDPDIMRNPAKGKKFGFVILYSYTDENGNENSGEYGAGPFPTEEAAVKFINEKKRLNSRDHFWENASLWVESEREVHDEPLGYNPPINEEQLHQRWFHATHLDENGKSIMASGVINPSMPTTRGHLAPQKGLTYVSRDLYTEAIYALGGVFMGHDYPESRYNESRYGWIFEVDLSAQPEVMVDEDEVGAMLTECLGNMDECKEPFLFGMAQKYVAPSRLRQVKDGYISAQSSVGKQLLKKMSDDEIRRLFPHFKNLAVRGALPIKAAWRLDKARAKEIAEDGSNLFDIAEQIL